MQNCWGQSGWMNFGVYEEGKVALVLGKGMEGM